MNELSAFTQCTLLLTARWGPDAALTLSDKQYFAFIKNMKAQGVSADALLGNPQLAVADGLGDKNVQTLLERSMGVFANVSKWLSAGIWIATEDDELYPDRLRERGNRPVVVYGVGNPNGGAVPAVTIVGSRDADESDLGTAKRLGGMFASEGFCVVSGGARGVDQAAMQGAASEGGKVIGILPDSLLRQVGRPDSRQGVEDGNLCLFSEVHPEAGFSVAMAMARNRLLYACADLGIVVQSDVKKGGTWAGAETALRDKFPVYVCSSAVAAKQLAQLGATELDIKILDSARALYEDALAKKAERAVAGQVPQFSLFDEAAG